MYYSVPIVIRLRIEQLPSHFHLPEALVLAVNHLNSFAAAAVITGPGCRPHCNAFTAKTGSIWKTVCCKYNSTWLFSGHFS